MWKKLWHALTCHNHSQKEAAGSAVLAGAAAPADPVPEGKAVPVAPIEPGAQEMGPEAQTAPAKPTAAKLVGACPSYAAKSVVGQRMTMEDSWQAVPDLLMVPRWWTINARDRLPTPIPLAGQEANPADAGQAPPAAPEPVSPCEDAAASTSEAAAADTATNGNHEPHAAKAVHTEPIAVHFFAVYDGHGGPDVAKHCAKTLHEHLRTIVTSSLAEPEAAAAAPAGPVASSATEAAEGEAAKADAAADRVEGLEAALKVAFLRTDAQLAEMRSAHEVGTTAVVSLVTARHLWVGNCGDSRALLCREQEAVALSLDHKATRADEVTRVEQAGGYVWWDRVMGELAVSRAIGDHCLRPFVIAEPEVTTVLRRPQDHLLLMASDGLWDVFTNEEARQLALQTFHSELLKTGSSKMAVKKVASSLAKAALDKGSRDNVTVVAVDVRWVSGTAAAATATARANVSTHSAPAGVGVGAAAPAVAAAAPAAAPVAAGDGGKVAAAPAAGAGAAAAAEAAAGPGASPRTPHESDGD